MGKFYANWLQELSMHSVDLARLYGAIMSAAILNSPFTTEERNGNSGPKESRRRYGGN
jgi:hypothetical protein